MDGQLCGDKYALNVLDGGGYDYKKISETY